ncbi:MAG: hypothetical protein GY870_12525 [archaeon]|nr:hypothetical protein [archaeon]
MSKNDIADKLKKLKDGKLTITEAMSTMKGSSSCPVDTKGVDNRRKK